MAERGLNEQNVVWGAGFMFRGGPTYQHSCDGKGNGHMSIRTALENRLERLKNNDKGFTLIELLVVVIIIGILAAIAIPVFLGQQASARESAAQADLATAKVAYVSYLVSTPAGVAAGTTYATAPQALIDFGFVDGVVVDTVGANGAFCLEVPATRHQTDSAWRVTNASNTPLEGACP